MTDQAALLAAVIASPDEDLPRLVMADWLEEHGQAERAEFIRVQIAFAKTSDAWERQRKKKKAMKARAIELLKANMPVWVEEVFGPFDQLDRNAFNILGASVREEYGWANMYWQRGFVDQILISWLDWLNEFDGIKRCDSIRVATPLQKVILVDCPIPVAVHAAGGFGGWAYRGVIDRVCQERNAHGAGFMQQVYRERDHARTAFQQFVRVSWPGIDFDIEEMRSPTPEALAEVARRIAEEDTVEWHLEDDE